MGNVATLHVRNVPEPLYEALRARAEVRGRSIANETIAILAENVARGVGRVPGLQVQGGTLARSRRPRERLSEPSSRVLAAASYEAHALGSDHVDTEHMLLALLGESSIVAAVESLGVTADDVRAAVARNVERGGSTEPGARPFTPGAKRVLEAALRESLSLGDGIIGPDHVLMALAAEEEGGAARALRELGVDLDRVRSVLAAPAPTGPEPAWEYQAVALTGSADAWTETMNALAEEGWQLVELAAAAGEQRAVFRRPRAL
jgi:ATP-dependent Clp protease ATP-binding subunit ClpC